MNKLLLQFLGVRTPGYAVGVGRRALLAAVFPALPVSRSRAGVAWHCAAAMEASSIWCFGVAVAGAGLVAVTVVLLAALLRDGPAVVLAVISSVARTTAFRGNRGFARRVALRPTVVA